MITSLNLRFYQVGCGDAIHVEFAGNDGKLHHILIDGGFKKTYRQTIRKVLESVDKIDLWILTHIDRDHIGAAIAFAEGSEFHKKVNKIWFNNHESFKISAESHFGKISFGQAISLNERFIKLAIPVQNDIYDELPEMDLAGLRLTVLAPNHNILKQFKKDWKDVEESSKIASAGDDYAKSISDLAKLPDSKENQADIANQSSIALLMEYGDCKILFLGDSPASMVIQGLKKRNQKLGLPENTPLKVDFVKLAHHGSKHNYQNALLDGIICNQFIISSNGGGTYNLPNKVVLAKILNHPKREGHIRFIFNYDNKNLRDIFSKPDSEPVLKMLDFSCDFPKKGDNYFHLKV